MGNFFLIGIKIFREVIESLEEWDSAFEKSIVYTGFLILTYPNWIMEFGSILLKMNFKVQNEMELEDIIKFCSRMLKQQNIVIRSICLLF